jgi:hypothetical protein
MFPLGPAIGKPIVITDGKCHILGDYIQHLPAADVSWGSFNIFLTGHGILGRRLPETFFSSFIYSWSDTVTAKQSAFYVYNNFLNII